MQHRPSTRPLLREPQALSHRTILTRCSTSALRTLASAAATSSGSSSYPTPRAPAVAAAAVNTAWACDGCGGGWAARRGTPQPASIQHRFEPHP
eukprot:349584-Chlamydomonas_euryale.AAC.3